MRNILLNSSLACGGKVIAIGKLAAIYPAIGTNRWAVTDLL
jgi:hypothetical protein